eukprot:scaffold42584_cov155-Skeletonema_dohrnii-CCMP3373.AAC.4
MTIHKKDHLLQGKRLKSFCNTSNIDKGVTRNSEGMMSGVRVKSERSSGGLRRGSRVSLI